MKEEEKSYNTCTKHMLPVHDTLAVLNGKWKLPIIVALMFGNKRFSEIRRQIPNITDKMLSKELRDLEINELVKRTVYDEIPVSVEYTLTNYGQTLQPVIDILRIWGEKHRETIMHGVESDVN